MITYKLAKELKDTGFPFRPFAWYERGVYVRQKSDDEYRKQPMQPSLSELIEACMRLGLFLSLTYCGEDEWEGVGVKNVEELDARGESPEEAVARLWLALNKK